MIFFSRCDFLPVRPGSPLSLDHETSFHEEMISNYLSAARVRFDTHLKDKERRDNLHVQNGGPGGKTRCASPGCELFGIPATNYLCANCFSKQKVQLEEMTAQRETTSVGKSTFYASTKGEDLGELPNNLRSTPGTPRAALPKLNAVSTQEPAPGDAEIVVKPCRTPECAFFGQERTDYLCSQCFKQKSHTCLPAPDFTNAR